MKIYSDEEAVEWADNKLTEPNAMTDGGCTMSPDFNFKECCLRHDVMLNHNQGITDKQAHRILRECITDHEWSKLAWLYWAYVTFSSAMGGSYNAAVISIIVIGGGWIAWFKLSSGVL